MEQSDLDKIIKNHKIYLETDGKEGQKAYLTDVDLTDAYLTDANLTNANLTNANLTNANLTNVDLTNANLTNVDLYNANLTGVDLTNVDLTKASLSHVYLTGVKGLIHIQLSKHGIYAQKEKVKIGCEYLTYQEWEEKGEDIGKREGYSDKEIKMYLNIVKFIQQQL